MKTKTYDECYFLNYEKCTDFAIYEIGKQKCPPSYSFGPIIRSRIIFHYILSGSGTLYINDQSWHIHAHQGFVIPAHAMAYYKADNETPWDYAWVHLDGPMVRDFFQQAGITNDQPVFRPLSHSLELDEIMYDLLHNYEREYYCIGKIYEMFEYILSYSSTKVEKGTNLQLEYVRKVINYIQLKYCDHIQVNDISNICGLERSYITKLFKTATGYTLQEYLIFYRINIACDLLKDTNHSIQHIALAVGYNDAFTFSKAFKRLKKISPTDYRNQLKYE